MKYYLSLGSNLGDREKNLHTCMIKLKEIGTKVISASSIYETEPYGINKQPNFLNQVVEIEANIDPEVLLNKINKMERQMGRVGLQADKSPRKIDIDILLAEDKVINSEKLIIPHPRMHLRNFVLIPLKEIAPQIEHPVLLKSIKMINKMCLDKKKVNIYKRNERIF